jgi:hypothetical protein
VVGAVRRRKREIVVDGDGTKQPRVGLALLMEILVSDFRVEEVDPGGLGCGGR